jgi:TRAP-type C4-dicarboxylate transport system permease small subunit
MKLLAAYYRFSSWLQRGLPIVSGVLIALAGTLMVVEVISRYLFHLSHSVMDEIPKYLVLLATFLVAPIMLKLGKHINIDILPEVLKGRKKTIVMLIIHFLTLMACAYMVIASINGILYLYKAGTVSSSELEMPLWILPLCMSIGSVLLTMYSLELFIRAIVSLIGAKCTETEVAP